MEQLAPISQSAEPFEFVSFEDPENTKYVSVSDEQGIPWIDPNMLKLSHRIGRGPFGDVWIATRHVSTEDYDEYHEVALKMLPLVKEEHVSLILTKFREMFYKCQCLQDVCFLYGITMRKGNVCIAMKFYDGSIGDKMAHLKGGKLLISDVLRYGADLAQAIMNLHSRGLLVLNLKPCNFLLNEQDKVILGDIGIPSLLHGTSFSNKELAQRLGTPNYMAPEQWQSDIRGPISYETDSWGFGCSIVEMLSGVQPWNGRTPREIYQMVVVKQDKPIIPNGLPPLIENILHGCFEYDLRNRPLMGDILQAFMSCKDSGYEGFDITGARNQATHGAYTDSDWSLSKDYLQVGDIVRSRKGKDSCKPDSMKIPDGTVVGMEKQDGFALVRVHGMHHPQRVHHSSLERVSFGFAAGDWVRLKVDDKKRSPVGIVHSVDRDGRVSAGFIGLETLWTGSYRDLQMASAFCVGQFVKVKASILEPRFNWPLKTGSWATGKISQILPNGCLVVKFPGKLAFGEAESFFADPAEAEPVSFSTCDSMVKKYQHLEDLHWAVRPLIIVLGIFTALKVGIVVGKSVRKQRKKGQASAVQSDKQHPDSSQNSAWLPTNVASILFREGS